MDGMSGPGHDRASGRLRGPAAGARPRWWRRNAVALVALVVLVPLTAGAMAWQEWRTAFGATHWRSVPVEAGGSIELGGASIGPAALVAVPTDAGVEVPADGRALAAQVTVVPGDEPVSCARPRLVELGSGRSWEAEPSPFDWQGEPSCFDATSPVLLNVPFAVPTDAGPFAIDLEILHDGAELPRFLVDQP